MADHKRYSFFNINKYQKRILLVTFLPILIVCTLLAAFITIFFKEVLNVILYQTSAPAIQLVNKWGIIVFMTLWIFLVGVFFWACLLTRTIVGAFERIMHEMDDVIDGKKREHIHARSHDQLAHELLKRINVFIDHLPPGKLKSKD